MSGFDFMKITMAAPRKAEITIYERIGPEDWDGKGVDASEVKKELDGYGDLDEITVRINSPGGNAFHGLAIYNLLATNKAKKTVYVDGVAASAASIIAMCGDEIVMNTGSLMMIHEASIMAWGNKGELENAIKLLDATNSSAVKVYQKKTGLPEQDIRDLLKAETWMTDTDAVAKKFADRINENVKAVAATLDPQQLSNAPDWVKARFASPVQGSAPQEPSMTTTSPAASTPPAAPAATPAPAATAAAPATPPASTAPPPSASSAAGTPAPAAATASVASAAAPAAGVPAAAGPDLVAQERERSSKLVALCSQAGHPELAAKFVEDPHMTVEAATSQLLTVVCQDRAPLGDAGGSSLNQPKDPTAEFKQEYKASQAVFASMGVTEEMYVESRLVDSGEKKLATAPAQSPAK